jgi:hypothetical protein
MSGSQRSSRPRSTLNTPTDATWDSLHRGDDAARRLGRAIDWLNLAWLNASGLTDDLRVPALRSGFEVLLDADDSEVLAQRLSPLIGDATPIRHRKWTSRAGNPKSANMRDVAWWFMEFCFLRNDLMHGGSPAQSHWIHDGAVHTDLGEWWLRQAIKQTVANDGHPEILDDLLWRDAHRAARDFLQSQQTEDDDEDENGES